jgi:hypothetical protein
MVLIGESGHLSPTTGNAERCVNHPYTAHQEAVQFCCIAKDDTKHFSDLTK